MKNHHCQAKGCETLLSGQELDRVAVSRIQLCDTCTRRAFPDGKADKDQWARWRRHCTVPEPKPEITGEGEFEATPLASEREFPINVWDGLDEEEKIGPAINEDEGKVVR